VHPDNRNIRNNRTGGCLRDHSSSSRNPDGISCDREKLVTDVEDATNYRAQSDNRNIRNNQTGYRLWDQSSSSRNPNGISGDRGNDNRMQSGNPNGSSQSERENDGNDLNSTGVASASRHAKDNPMLANTTSGTRVTNDSINRPAVASINIVEESSTSNRQRHLNCRCTKKSRHSPPAITPDKVFNPIVPLIESNEDLPSFMVLQQKCDLLNGVTSILW